MIFWLFAVALFSSSAAGAPASNETVLLKLIVDSCAPLDGVSAAKIVDGSYAQSAPEILPLLAKHDAWLLHSTETSIRSIKGGVDTNRGWRPPPEKIEWVVERSSDPAVCSHRTGKVVLAARPERACDAAHPRGWCVVRAPLVSSEIPEDAATFAILGGPEDVYAATPADALDPIPDDAMVDELLKNSTSHIDRNGERTIGHCRRVPAWHGKRTFNVFIDKTAVRDYPGFPGAEWSEDAADRLLEQLRHDGKCGPAR